ncbi:MAG: Ig-like domain repeat protein [Acidobacteriaceae bacterium]
MNPNRILPSLLRAVAGIFAASLMTAGLSAQVIAGPVVPNRITQPIDNNFRVTLHGMVSPLANAANDRGAAPESMQVDRIHMVLKRSTTQEAALRSLIQAQNTPGSPEYHKWLTPAEFGQKFGPSSQDIAKIQSWLESEGFSGVKVNPGALTVEFNGTASQFSHAFGAEFHRYQVNGKTYDAVANNPQIPEALAPVVQGFVALNNFPVHKYSRVLGKATYDPQTHKTTADWAYPQSGGVENVVSPQDFGVEYNLPNNALNSNYSSALPQYTGAGQTIAIINEANINVSLVNSYRSLFGLPPNPPHVIIVGNDPGIDGINNPDGPNGASIEAYLDVEEAGAVAPDATIDLVIAGDTASENGLILAAEHAVYSDVAPVMSLSFGQCEQQLGASNAFINQLWEQAAAEGITVMVSTGDSGSAGCDSSSAQYATNGLAVSGLASTPYDVAVGGTDFYYSDYQSASQLQTQIGTYWNLTGSNTPQASILQHIPEQAWNDSQFGDDALNYHSTTGSTTVGAGSGGASSCATGTVNTSTGAYSSCTAGYAKPAWQAGLGVPADKVRDIPDVSLFAADGVNYSFYPICAQDGDCQTPASGSPAQITGVGGTSAASPAFAGIMALVNEKYGPQGQADNVLYALAAQYPSAFYDVAAGTNSVPCEFSPTLSPNCISVSNPISVTTSSGASVTEGQLGSGTTPSYNATAGYDLATGLGSVNAANLVADWGNVTFASSTVTLTSPTAGASITHGQAVTFSGTVTGLGSTPPSGDVVIQTSSTEPGQQSQTYFTLSGGAFSGTTSALPGGTYNIWAQYSGDTTNQAGTSAPVQITVSQESSTLLFQGFTTTSSGTQTSVSGQSIPYGTQVYFDATPYGSAYYAKCVNVTTKPSSCQLQSAATGTVTFTDSSTVLNTAVVDSEGTAEYVTPALTVGSHSITAAYSGDNSYDASSGSAINVTVTKATPTILVTAPATNGNTGQNYVLTVLVASNGIGVAPTGTLTVSGAPTGTTASAMLGSTADPTYGNTSAIANIVIPGTAAVGTYNLTISYGGDSNYNTASTTYSFTEDAAATGSASSISASATPTSSSVTSEITAKATVTGQSGHPAPTGTVYFVEGLLNLSSTASSQFQEYVLAQGTLTAGSGDTSTVSTQFNSGSLVQGDNYMTVYYAGDSNYAPSSTVLNLSNPLSDFSMVAELPLVPIKQSLGMNTATDTVNLTSVNGFSGTVGLTCTAPSEFSCTLDQSSVNLTSSTTITTGPVSELHKLMLFGSGGGIALGCLFLIGVPARKRKWRTMIGMVLVFAVLSFGMLGCGGGSSSGSGGGFGGGGGSGSGGGTTVSSSSNGGSSSSNGGNVTVPVKVTITGNGNVAVGSYQVVVTGTASSTSQVHTITITAVVQ